MENFIAYPEVDAANPAKEERHGDQNNHFVEMEAQPGDTLHLYQRGVEILRVRVTESNKAPDGLDGIDGVSDKKTDF